MFSWKKFSAVVLVICLMLSTKSVFAGTETINSALISKQTWSDSTVTFTSGGSLSVSGTAASASGNVILSIENDPSVETEITDADGKVVNAHVYAHNTSGDAITINLEDGASLTLPFADATEEGEENEGTEKKGITLAAYYNGNSGYSSTVIKINGTESGGSEVDLESYNKLYSSSYSSYNNSYSVAIGSGSGSAAGISVNINGRETLSALTCGAAHVFGTNGNTDKGNNAYGWRVGIYADDTVTSDTVTVNALAGILSTKPEIKNGMILTLSNDQSTARSFALGKDYQIYVGGKSVIEKDTGGNVTGTRFDQVTNKSGTLNIFGGIIPASGSTKEDLTLPVSSLNVSRVADSSLTIDSGWTMNIYGPVEGLSSIKVTNGTLNTYGSVKDITLDEGTINVYGESDGIGTICLRSGVLKLCKCEDNNAETVLNDMASKIKIAGENGKLCSVSSIESENFCQNFGTSGKLILQNGDNIVFYVNTDEKDPDIQSASDGFELVKGYIEVESSLSDALDFANGSVLYFINEGTSAFRTNDMDFAFIRGRNMTVQQLIGDNDVDCLGEIEGQENVWIVDTSKLNVTDGASASSNSALKQVVRALRASTINMEEARVLAINGGDGNAYITYSSLSDVIIGTDVLAYVNGGLVTMNLTATSMFRNSVNARLTNIGNAGRELFVTAIGGHTHQGELSGIGYRGDMYGIVAGGDKVLKVRDNTYIRVGGLLGYLYSDADFYGSAITGKQGVKQDIYSAALYGVYESINAKQLRTDINVYLGLGYSDNRLSRSDDKMNEYSGKIKSHNEFILLELVKNFYAVRDVQIGIWLKADYNHIYQRGYQESSLSGT